MDFLILMFIIFMVLGPVMGYSRYNNRRQLPPGQNPAQFHGPYGQQPNPFQQRQIGYGQQQAGYGQMVPYQQAQQPITAEAFNASKAALGDDITTFGTELRDLDLEVVGRELSPEAREDYTRALDAYDGAKAQLDRTQYVNDLKRVAEILEEGRFAVASVKARVNGLPVPEHRAPCFFDPAHGPSAEDIMWAPAGGAARKVPACAADAQRVRLGNDPSIRMVGQGAQMVPYWDDQSYAPYAQGYYGRYGGDPAIRGLAQGALMLGGFSLLMGLFDN